MNGAVVFWAIALIVSIGEFLWITLNMLISQAMFVWTRQEKGFWIVNIVALGATALLVIYLIVQLTMEV